MAMRQSSGGWHLRFHQAALIVADRDRTVQNFREVLGLEVDAVVDRSASGNRVAHYFFDADSGEQNDIELIEPGVEGSFFHRFLTEHGDCLHHLSFDTDDFERAFSDLVERQGFPCLIRGRAVKDDRVQYAFIDTTERLGFVTELINHAEVAELDRQRGSGA